MIFWICVIAAIVGFIMVHAYEHNWFKTYEVGEACMGFGCALAIIGAAASIIMAVVIAFSQGTASATIAGNNVRREMLVYQYENDIYENDNDLGKRELMVDIQEWNEDLVYYQAVQDNFWVGIFYPNIYDQFEFIELKEMTSDVQN